MGRCFVLACSLAVGGCHLLFPFHVDPPTGRDAGTGDSIHRREAGPDSRDSALPREGSVGPDAPQSCSPLGHKALLLGSSGAGDWTVTLEPQMVYAPVTIGGAGPVDAAATADLDVNGQQVAGLVISRKGVGSVDLVSEAMVKAIMGSSPAQLRSVGTRATTHDGYPALVDTTFRITLPGASPLSGLRDTILAAVLKNSSLGGLPAAWGTASTSFTLRISTVLRPGDRAIFVGAVTNSASDSAGAKRARIIAGDLTSTTGLARHGGATDLGCERKTIAQPLRPVEIIWVMDESGSMYDNRASIAANAASFFKLALANNLDFRMGVTNVCAPNRPATCLQGTFCSVSTTVGTHMGGADRFLLPTEQSIFEACIKNPPGYEAALEHGLDNASAAVKRHLPRKAAVASKIRPEAQVVIITVTDEIPHELSLGIPSAERSQCTLSAVTQGAVNAGIKPYLDYLKGGTDPEAAVSSYHVIGGICGGVCSADMAHGYRELAALLDGAVHDICPADLGPTITKIIKAIKTAAGGITLAARPISASLRVALDGKSVPRGLTGGFNYDPLKRVIRFVGPTAPVKGSKLVVSYSRWK